MHIVRKAIFDFVIFDPRADYAPDGRANSFSPWSGALIRGLRSYCFVIFNCFGAFRWYIYRYRWGMECLTTFVMYSGIQVVCHFHLHLLWNVFSSIFSVAAILFCNFSGRVFCSAYSSFFLFYPLHVGNLVWCQSGRRRVKVCRLLEGYSHGSRNSAKRLHGRVWRLSTCTVSPRCK